MTNEETVKLAKAARLVFREANSVRDTADTNWDNIGDTAKNTWLRRIEEILSSGFIDPVNYVPKDWSRQAVKHSWAEFYLFVRNNRVVRQTELFLTKT